MNGNFKKKLEISRLTWKLRDLNRNVMINVEIETLKTKTKLLPITNFLVAAPILFRVRSSELALIAEMSAQCQSLGGWSVHRKAGNGRHTLGSDPLVQRCAVVPRPASRSKVF